MVTDPALITVSLALGFIVAIAIGANDETMTPAVGAGLLSVGMAVFLGGVFNLIGVFFLGESVSKTVGNKFTTFSLDLNMVFVILISMALWLFIVSIKGVPISTTQSIVGSVIGVVLLAPAGGLNGLNFDTLFWVLMSWFISPLIGLVGGFTFYWLLMKGRAIVRTKGYDDYERQERFAAYALALFLLITVFSRSGNDVAKAIGPLMAIPEFEADPFPALLAGGLGMCLGVIFIGRRVVKKLATEIVALSPTSALAASISVSLIMFVGTLMAIPLSGSHILVAAFIGVGFVNKEKIDRDSLKTIGVSWVVTTPVSAVFAALIYLPFLVFGISL